jgi:hypothetical protein
MMEKPGLPASAAALCSFVLVIVACSSPVSAIVNGDGIDCEADAKIRSKIHFEKFREGGNDAISQFWTA